jgi:predicted amidophosphoribosyltransferase
MRIFGCPHCWPAAPEKRDRLCPVCGGLIDPRGYAIARYFERPGRKHVHVLGCTGCRIG